MQHHFAVHIEKKGSCADKTPIKGIFRTDSVRYAKVGKLFRAWATKQIKEDGTPLVLDKDIENIYIQKVK